MTTSFASPVNLGGLRESLRIRTGLPEEGESGKTRANRALNMGLREFFGDLPHMFEREEHRFRLTPKYSTGVLDVCPTDPRVFRVVADRATADPGTDDAGLPDGGELIGRWIDITDADGNVHRKRITYVTLEGGATMDTLFGDGSISRQIIVVDSPWENATDEDLAYAAFAIDYPLPPDWREVSDVYRLDGSSAPRLLTHVHSEQLERLRLTDDWLATGTVEQWSRGDFMQIRAPHDTPTVALDPAAAWGRDAGNVLHDSVGATPYYEAAGTFKYCYCLCRGYWGEAPGGLRDLDQVEPDLTAVQAMPWVMSAPSPASAEITSEWDAEAIGIRTANQEAVEFYTAAPAQPSWQRGGLTKLFFRARVAVESAVGPYDRYVEADGEFYLWRITSGALTYHLDRGDGGAPLVSFPLKDFAGHQSLRFNRIPASENTTIVVRGRRLPDVLKFDSDMARCPSDCTDALVYLAASILAGERSGDMKKVADYRALYEGAVRKLRRKYALSSGRPTPAGSIAGGRRFVGQESPVVEET